jgi:hypothetical protein
MKPFKSFFQAVLLASFGMLASCVADDINVNDSHKGNDMLCFRVNSIQDNGTRAMNNVRAATGDYALAFKKYLSVQGLSPKRLVLRKLPVADIPACVSSSRRRQAALLSLLAMPSRVRKFATK